MATLLREATLFIASQECISPVAPVDLDRLIEGCRLNAQTAVEEGPLLHLLSTLFRWIFPCPFRERRARKLVPGGVLLKHVAWCTASCGTKWMLVHPHSSLQLFFSSVHWSQSLSSSCAHISSMPSVCTHLFPFGATPAVSSCTPGGHYPS